MAGNLKNEEDFRIFAEEWGGNLIRWQFLQGGPAVFPDAESYLKWGRDRIGELRRVLPFFRKYGIKVVIDLHRSPGEMNDINNNLGLWTKERQDAVLRLWREIAAAFNGDPVLYGYDLVNEPIDKVYDVRSDALDWDRFAEKLAREIRSIDPVTPIIVETSYNPRPLNLPNIIYSPHFYEPGEYTHHPRPVDGGAVSRSGEGVEPRMDQIDGRTHAAVPIEIQRADLCRRVRRDPLGARRCAMAR